VKLQHYYFPWELEAALRDFVAYYNNERYHESLDNVTPADAYFGRKYAMVSERARIKQRTMQKRKKEYLAAMAAWNEAKNRLLAEAISSPKSFDDAHCHLATQERLSLRDHFMQSGAPPAALHYPVVGLHRQPGGHLGEDTTHERPDRLQGRSTLLRRRSRGRIGSR
jgi:hypothetical protein